VQPDTTAEVPSQPGADAEVESGADGVRADLRPATANAGKALMAICSASGRVSDGIRTRDRRDHNPELYQLSYAHQGSRPI
jgi:hypothetical protein